MSAILCCSNGIAVINNPAKPSSAGYNSQTLFRSELLTDRLAPSKLIVPVRPQSVGPQPEIDQTIIKLEFVFQEVA